jgi:hypothetical protein
MSDMEKLMSVLDENFPAWEFEFGRDRNIREYAQANARKWRNPEHAHINLRASLAPLFHHVINAAIEAGIVAKAQAKPQGEAR